MFKNEFENLLQNYGCLASRAIFAQLLWEKAGGETNAVREVPQKMQQIVDKLFIALARYDILLETTKLLLFYVQDMKDDVKIVNGELFFRKKQDF